MIDYILGNNKYKNIVKDVKVIPSEEDSESALCFVYGYGVQKEG